MNNRHVLDMKGGVMYDYFNELIQRRAPGWRIEEQFGASEGVSSAVMPFTLGDTAGDLVYPSTASQLNIVSTSADDDKDNVTTDGATSVAIGGVDINGDSTFETIELEGLTPVTTVNSYLRVNTMRAEMSAPTNAAKAVKFTNQGIITATHTDGLLQKIPAFGSRESILSFYTHSGRDWFPWRLVYHTDGQFRVTMQQLRNDRWIPEGVFHLGVNSDDMEIGMFTNGLILPGNDFRFVVENIEASSADISIHVFWQVNRRDQRKL